MPDLPFMRAHGHVPGPTQRPATAGVLDGLLASGPAVALLWLSGAMVAIGHSLDLAPMAAMWLQVGGLALAGAIYGRIFGRAANDRQGGWLFGISYGFIVWMVGPATLLQWSFGHPLAVGRAAQVLCGAYLVYGLVLGLVFPRLHSFLMRELD